MSKELIDRKALLEDLGKAWGIPDDWDGGIDETCESAFAIIENQPVAYDVDKVVEQLEEQHEGHIRYLEFEMESAVRHCIEIVKGGGLDE